MNLACLLVDGPATFGLLCCCAALFSTQNGPPEREGPAGTKGPLRAPRPPAFAAAPPAGSVERMRPCGGSESG